MAGSFPTSPMRKVIVAVRLPRELHEELGRVARIVGPEDDVEDAEALLCLNVDPGLLRRARGLRFIQVVTAGVDHLPWEHIPPGVVVSSNAGSNAAPVAEFAVALLLAAAKRILHFDRNMKGGVARPDVEVPVLSGSEVAVLGLGEIGRRVASMLSAMGMRVVGFSRRPKEGVPLHRFTTDLGDALSGQRYAVVALSLNKYTRGLLTYDVLSSMAEEGVLVNVARAEIVDREGIKRLLLERPRFVYATDVWWSRDDYSRDSDVIGLPNVIATPWVAGGYGSREVYMAMLRSAVENLARYLRGEQPRNIVPREDYV